MNGEEKKNKNRSKTVEVGFHLDDDEPIGSLFKLKRPKNPKKVVKVGLGGSGEKGRKSEAKEEKLVVENEDLGGMDDTLASFRKKLKGPKKDVGSGTLRGRGSALNGQVEDDGLVDAKLESKTVEKGGDMGDDGSDVILDKVENKGKGKVKEHGKGISHPGDEKLEDPLSVFFQRTQSGLTRKSRTTNSGLHQNTRAQNFEDGISPSTEGVSGVLTSGSVTIY